MEILKVDRQGFRDWLIKNSTTCNECYVAVKKGKPKDDKTLYYLDAVEESLCFGWIDSKYCKINGERLQRFTPRKTNVVTELNLERARRLVKLNLMTKDGLKVLPDLNREFILDEGVKNDIIKVGLYEKFLSLPPLYVRVRGYNLAFYKYKLPKNYDSAFNNFVKYTSKGLTYGEWNDYGRLLDY